MVSDAEARLGVVESAGVGAKLMLTTVAVVPPVVVAVKVRVSRADGLALVTSQTAVKVPSEFAAIVAVPAVAGTSGVMPGSTPSSLATNWAVAVLPATGMLRTETERVAPVDRLLKVAFKRVPKSAKPIAWTGTVGGFRMKPDSEL